MKVLNWWGQIPHFSHTPLYSKWTNQIRSQEERRHTNTHTHTHTHTHKPLLSTPFPKVPGDSLPTLDVWDTDVSFLQCWPQSIVVSRARGKHPFPLGLRKLGHCSPSGNKWLARHFYFSIIVKVSSIVLFWVLFSFSPVWNELVFEVWKDRNVRANEFRLYIKMDDASPLPPAIQKWS